LLPIEVLSHGDLGLCGRARASQLHEAVWVYQGWILKRTLVLAFICVAFGGLVGSGISRALAQQDKQPHAVMWLSQAHMLRLASAASERSCQSLQGELDSLRFMQGEIQLAFPAEFKQEAEFRARAAALRTALDGVGPIGTDCTAAPPKLKPIREACDACHRQYR
jgi:hypothetical protein